MRHLAKYRAAAGIIIDLGPVYGLTIRAPRVAMHAHPLVRRYRPRVFGPLSPLRVYDICGRSILICNN